MQCGHCGEQINKGFTVCRGCGAKRRRDYGAVFMGLLLGGGGFAWLQQNPHDWQLYVALGLIGLGLLMIRNGLRLKWYRYNP